MICLVLPLLIGFGIDCILGDPHSLPHPVVLIGKTISALECVLRRIFPKTPRGERAKFRFSRSSFNSPSSKPKMIQSTDT